MSFTVDTAQVVRLRLALIAVWVLLALSGVISLALIHIVETDMARDLGRFLSLGIESTPGTWVASALLGLCALLAALAALEAQASEPRWSVGWWILAAVFAIMSFDEVADVHGRLSPQISRLLGDTTGVFTFAWIFPAVVLGIGLLIVEGPFLRRLGTTGRDLVIAGGLFVAGAVGLEMVEGDLASQGDKESLQYGLSVLAEELLEFGAVMWVVMTIVRHLQQRLGKLSVLVQAGQLSPTRR